MTPRLQPLCTVARLIHFGPNQSIPHQTTTTTRYKLQNTRAQSQMAANNSVVAVLYQALAPPKYGGVSKPPKPGGTLISTLFKQHLLTAHRIPRLRCRCSIYSIQIRNKRSNTKRVSRSSKPRPLVFPRHGGGYPRRRAKRRNAPLGKYRTLCGTPIAKISKAYALRVQGQGCGSSASVRRSIR